MRKLKDPEASKQIGKSSPGGDLEIDTMRMQDLEEVMRIEKVSFSAPWSQSHFAHEIRRNPLAYPFVLRKKDVACPKIVGFCVCWIVHEELHVNNLAIAPACRNRGYGEILMRSVLEFGQNNSCRRAALEVRVSNQAAVRLYEKLGFRILGVAPNYYQDNEEDAYILIRKL